MQTISIAGCYILLNNGQQQSTTTSTRKPQFFKIYKKQQICNYKIQLHTAFRTNQTKSLARNISSQEQIRETDWNSQIYYKNDFRFDNTEQDRQN